MVRPKILTVVYLFGLLALLCGNAAARQPRPVRKTGSVTYVSPINIYVSFRSTDGIGKGDTLYASWGGRRRAVLTAKYISSSSVAGPIIGKPFVKVGDRIFAFVRPANHTNNSPPVVGEEVDTNLAAEVRPTKTVEVSPIPDTSSLGPHVYGGITVNSYSNISNYPGASRIQRWNYTFNLNADRIAGSRFSFSNYMYVSYVGSQWKQVAVSPLKNLRVYNLSLAYKIPGVELRAGRIINNHISGVGPMDGFQAEERFGNFTVGEIIGSRPDFYTLGYDPNLFQFGGYFSDARRMGAGLMTNTICFLQQYNHSSTDRRFIYFQHSSTPVRDINLYASGEIDLFKTADGKPASDFSLTDLFLSANYYPVRMVSFSLSYNAQRNIIYYRSFGSTLDSILESHNELRHDIRLEAQFRPLLYTYLSIGADYSFQLGDISPTRNANISVTQSRIPLLAVTTTLSYSRIFSSYVDGSVFSISVSKCIPFNSSNIIVGYSLLDYGFGTGSMRLIQKQPSIQATTRLLGNLFLNIYYQGTFSGPTSYNIFMGGITERF